MSNTKKMLIEVARQLFAEKGKKEVTMNDIAEASKKGRRTLYTYFNNKEEIYKAVIDKELDTILERLNIVSTQKTEPDVKLTNHIITHLDAVKDVVNRNGSLRADFFHDIYEVERKRRKIDVMEIVLIRSIISEGIEKNIFKRMDVDLSSIIIFYAIKGLEVPYIRQNISAEFEKNKNSIVEFVFQGIKKKESPRLSKLS
jgi:AcrR family transcriptional regulator